MAVLWGSAILSLRGTIYITFLVYQLDHIPLWGGSWHWEFVRGRA